MERQFDYGENTVFVATIKDEDASFNHELGTEKKRDVEVTDLNVIIYIDGIDFDITETIKEDNPSMYALYKDWCLKKYQEPDDIKYPDNSSVPF